MAYHNHKHNHHPATTFLAVFTVILVSIFVRIALDGVSEKQAKNATSRISGRTEAITNSIAAKRSDFVLALMQTVKAEYLLYNNLHECNSPVMRRRVAAYWDARGRALNGCNRKNPWSAAFISFMALSAGAGSNFPYSAEPSILIQDAFNGDRGLSDSARDIGMATARAGDIARTGPSSIRNWTFHEFEDWFINGGAHMENHLIRARCDIVTAVHGSNITVIGGNINHRIAQNFLRR